MRHDQISAIQVMGLPDHILKIVAYADHQVVLEQSFSSERDFQFIGGKVLLPSRRAVSGAGEPGNPFIGAMQTDIQIGMDSVGKGYVQETTTFAGTAFLVIPVAGKINETIHFETDPSLCVKKAVSKP
ncbi:MAG: hypothetical protein EP334_05185 [Gammaproteobacteria bacterium]|nr:MAG: hypothetical protein EP334_05185 [Gammaproteobacteria bacterium]